VARSFARSVRGPAALLFALGVPAACTLLNPLGEYERGSARDGGGADVLDGAGDAAVEACARTRWPVRPTVDDGTDNVEFVDALVSFSAEPDPDAGDVVQGYDLDGVCTCPEPESCTPRANAAPHCDGPGGIDNAGGELLTTIAQLVDKKADTNSRLRSGDYGLLFRVRGYNGGANDREVELAVFLSNGTDGIQDGGVPPAPKYDGADRWTVDPKSLAGGTAPPYVPISVDPHAYVADHVIVATVDFPLRLGRMTVELVGSVVTGTLTKDAIGYRVNDGVIAGRSPARTFLTNLAAIDDPFVPGGHLCGASVTYQDVKTKVCASADIFSDLKQDNTSAPCDALAVSAHFTASAAQLGSVFAPPPPTTPCGPQWVDDCSN
jgi:hypothetical protein